MMAHVSQCAVVCVYWAAHLIAFIVEGGLHCDQGTEHAVLLQHLIYCVANPAWDTIPALG